jgi:competence protein ComEA
MFRNATTTRQLTPPAVRPYVEVVRTRVWLFGCAWLLASAAFAASGARAFNQDPPAPSGAGMPDGPGKDVTVRACGTCHEPVRAASVRLTKDGWADLIERMKARGARITDAETPVVLEYLSTHFLGEAERPINVNTAPAIDFEMVAGLLRREATAVIDYRDKNGPFKTLDDMKKVPGLDFKKIDTRRDRLVAF